MSILLFLIVSVLDLFTHNLSVAIAIRALLGIAAAPLSTLALCRNCVSSVLVTAPASVPKPLNLVVMPVSCPAAVPLASIHAQAVAASRSGVRAIIDRP